MAVKTDGLTIDDLAQHPEVQYVAGKSVKETVRELALTTRFDVRDVELYIRELFPLYSELQAEVADLNLPLLHDTSVLKRFWGEIIARQQSDRVNFSELERYFLYHDPSLPALLAETHYTEVEQRAQPGGPRPNPITGLVYALRFSQYNLKTVPELEDYAMRH